MCVLPKERMSLHASQPEGGRRWGAAAWCEVQGDYVDLRVELLTDLWYKRWVALRGMWQFYRFIACGWEAICCVVESAI